MSTVQIIKQVKEPVIGRALKTKEGFRLVRGAGRFVEDVRLPNMAFAAILRSPYAHARINSVDCSRAISAKGVIGVLTSEDVTKMADPLPQMTIPPASNIRDYPIAVRKVCYVGEPVAVVIAESKSAAEDALELISVEYEILEPVLNAENALTSKNVIHEEIGSNIMGHVVYDYGNIGRAISSADRVLDVKIHFHRFSSTPLEPNAAVASYDKKDGSLTVWCNNQEPAFMMPQFNSALKLPYDKMRFITMDIGGGYGCKIINYSYVILVSLASMKTGRPVSWVETRTEHMLAASHGAERIFDVKVPVKKDGTVLGLKIKSIDDDGAYARHEPAGLTVWAQVVPGAYKIKNVSADMYAVFTNKCPAGPNRGFARAPHLFMIERVIDIVAKELNLDPAEVRMKNYITRTDQPYVTPNGCVYDDGDYPKSLQIVLDTLDYASLRKTQRESFEKEGKILGIGIATTLDSGAPNFGQVKMLNPRLPLIGNTEACELQLTPDGRFVVKLGTVPQGQSHETVSSQIVADTFDVSTEDVHVATGFDSGSHPYTMHSGTYGSRYAAMGGGAVLGASRKLKEKVLLIGAHLLQEKLSDVELSEGKVQFKNDPKKNISLKRLARTAYGMPALMPPGMEQGLWTIFVYYNGLEAPDERKIGNLTLTYSYQTHGVVGELDPETCKFKVLKYVIVDDAGRLINPLVVEGQVHGAALHGYAAAMFEEYSYTSEGQPEGSTFIDYLAPYAVDVPNFEVKHFEIPSPFSALGAKGMGEGGGTAHVAVANAINDALRLCGAAPLEKSIAPPEAVYKQLKAKR